MKHLRLVAFVALLWVVPGLGSRPMQGAGSTLDILQAELQRNFQVLSKEQTPAYYVAYTVADQRSAQIVASFGALQRSGESRSRFATVEVRVGDYTLDNTHPIRGDARAAAPRVNQVLLPLTDDEQPIRQALWTTTDRAYKQATEGLTRVKTNVAAKVKEDDPAPDFSREDPQTFTGAPISYALDTKTWEARLRRVSAPFADDPLIYRSDVSLSAESVNRSFANSEGSRVESGRVAFRLFIQAVTKADDGMELPLYQTYFATTQEGLPDEKQLLSDARSMIDLLAQLRKAPLVDPYSGPAILSGRAAGVFFHEIFGHRVEANRQRSADDGQTFTAKVDQPILPSFLSVVFDPTLTKLGSTELMGHYVYDDEGVKGRRVTVVDKGVLKTFLLDRAPIRGFARSNGHGRAEPGNVPVSRQSNLVVESSRSMSFENLTDMLRTEAKKQGKPFGLLFDNIEGGFTNTGRGSPNAFNVLPNVVYRIYTDEKRAPELVRGVDLIGTPLTAFARIIATGNKADVFNGVCGAESGWVPVSASSPPLLVSEVEVQKKAQSMEALPILSAPRAAR
ncbi:MAG: TldD/PmbA family protein [Vicinamibacterales bacterium]